MESMHSLSGPIMPCLGGLVTRWFLRLKKRFSSTPLPRLAQPEIVIKGDTPFTENYSVIGPEVLTGPMDEMLGSTITKFIQQLQEFDRLIIAGQAKSHCVAWTVSDLLDEITRHRSGTCKESLFT